MFVFIDIWIIKQRYAVFYGEFENEEKKGQKNFEAEDFQ